MSAVDDGDFLALEHERLAAIASDSWYARGVNEASIRYSTDIFARFWRGGACLELGAAEGVMTEALVEHFGRVVAVDGSDELATGLRERFPTVDVRVSLFETFEPGERFDVVVMGHILEHVADPRDLLRRCTEWLTEGGMVCAAVPNARSLHRQAAVFMGMLEREDELNETDLHHGHRRVFTPESFRAAFRAAGLALVASGGYWLKPVSNGQIEQDWTDEMIAAFMKLGEQYPDIAGEIYVVGSRPNERVLGA